MITLDNVTMQYPIPRRMREYVLHPFSKHSRFTALNAVSLRIEDGERIAFLGPNGAGKTSLLKLIGGILLPTRGTVVVNGFDTLRDNTAAKKRVGLVFNEERSFYWRLTGLQNLEFFGAIDNLSGTKLRERIRELISLVGLEGHSSKPVGGYSSGMKQRLAIARGLISDPDILILDEPTRTLDPIAADTLIDLIINRIHSDMRKTLLIATHQLEKAPALCEKICIINNGRIAAFTGLSEIVRKESLSDYYRRSIS
jgi:ABC-2 type transport system ATP-binding protein